MAGCPGDLGELDGSPLPDLTVASGQQITITNLSLDYSTPRSDNPRVVAVGTETSGKAQLVSVSSGTATIEIKTPFCYQQEDSGFCPGLTVHVTPAD